MRAVLALAVLAAGCAATVRDLPAGGAAPGSEALLAGRLAFEGTRIRPSLWLRHEDGDEVVVRPEGGAFLVAVPPGRYEIRRFGSYAVTDDCVTIEAVLGRAGYIGSFHAVRDRTGRIAVEVRDSREDVARILAARYGASLPPLESALAASALEPLDDGPLVIAVHWIESYYPYYGYPYFRFGYGYGYYSGHGYQGPHRPPPPRPPPPSSHFPAPPS